VTPAGSPVAAAGTRSHEHDTLATAVQFNSDLGDALHAREKSLCTYLLGMREYFRWSTGLPLGAAPDRGRLSEWISQREQQWDALRDQGAATYADLPLAGGIDPFDEASANRELQAIGLVYGAGLGLFGAPMFFLARCESDQLRDGVRVIVAGAELARGITAAPAVSRNNTILIRSDALRRWLWTRTETALRGPRDNVFALALRAYGADADVEAAVVAMAAGEAETLVLHELGELHAGHLLGAEWEEMLLDVGDRRTEVVIRAVRDLLADCLVTLPRLTARTATRSLLFWQANFDGLRRALAPELAEACRTESGGLDFDQLERAVDGSRRIWEQRASELLAGWRKGGAENVKRAAQQLAGSH
jgi:hypothetical protein